MRKILLSSILCAFLVSSSNADVRFGGSGFSSGGSGSHSSGGGSSSGGSSSGSSGGSGSHSSGGGSSSGDGSSSGSGSGSEDSSNDNGNSGAIHSPQMPDNPHDDDDNDGEQSGKHSDFGEHKPPSKPDFSHAKKSTKSVKLKWEDNTDNELGYKVFRDGELIKILPPNSTEFRDTDLQAGKEYTYEIKPFNEFGEGDGVTKTVTTKSADTSHVEDHLKDHLEKFFDDDFDTDKLKDSMKKYENGKALSEVYKELFFDDGAKLSDNEFVTKLYDVLLDQELTQEEAEALVKKLQDADMTREEMFYDVISSDDFESKVNSDNIDDALNGDEDQKRDQSKKVAQFVKRFYTELLTRTPEEGGYNYWAEELSSKDMSAKDIAKQFFNSDEFKSKNLNNEDFVKIVYKVIMGREADDAGVDFWKTKLDEGMSRDELLNSFLDANEFDALAKSYDIGSSDKVKDFVERFYTKALKRDADPNGSGYWSKELKEARKSAKEVAKQFFSSDEFKNQNLTDEEFISVVYETLMGRDADDAGKTYWLNQLQSGVSRDEMIDQFLKSDEFKKFALDSGVLIDKYN